jgi:hypothetical protein
MAKGGGPLNDQGMATAAPKIFNFLSFFLNKFLFFLILVFFFKKNIYYKTHDAILLVLTWCLIKF